MAHHSTNFGYFGSCDACHVGYVFLIIAMEISAEDGNLEHNG